MPARTLPNGTSQANGDESMDGQTMLFLCHDWDALTDGICSVNSAMASSLTSFEGIRVCSTVLKPKSEVSNPPKNGVYLIYPRNDYPHTSLNANLTKTFNEEPRNAFDDSFEEEVGDVTHIIGHSPITADAALKLRDTCFPKAKVILVYHMIPEDVMWTEDELPYRVPAVNELVELAQSANVVYSVTQKLYWFFTAKFRNRASAEIDHRLYIPLCSEDIFNVERSKSGEEGKIIALGCNYGGKAWEGLDIAACSYDKVANSPKLTLKPSELCLAVGGVCNPDVAHNVLKQHVISPDLKTEVKAHLDERRLCTDLRTNSICIVPSRGEPLGHVGLEALSAGIPTLISEDLAVASLIRRLTSEPEYFLVPVTKNKQAVRQDASIWMDRIRHMLADPKTAHERATQLKMALRRDEDTKETHDDFVTYCLNGINLKHEVADITFIKVEHYEKELEVKREFQDFLTTTMRQCWRLKHHPLTKKSDLLELVSGVKIPVDDLVEHVIDKIEEYDRRIIGVNPKSQSFIVYCPRREALRDLWAMCDVINNRLVTVLVPMIADSIKEALLGSFGLSGVFIRTLISGPEFLKYRNLLPS